MFIASPGQAYVVEAGDQLRVTGLVPGWHLLTNGVLNDPEDERITRVRAELRSADTHSIAAWVAAAERICALRGAKAQPPVCLVGTDRGTVSSTIVVLSDDASQSIYHYADGVPASAGYRDLSTELRRLLASRESVETEHRIRLRGPWQQSFDDRHGWVRFFRNFNRPTNLTAVNRVLVVFENARGTGPVRLNGQWLGVLSELEKCQCFDLTNALQAHNQLEIQIAVDGTAAQPCDRARLGEVSLEIRSG